MCKWKLASPIWTNKSLGISVATYLSSRKQFRHCRTVINLSYPAVLYLYIPRLTSLLKAISLDTRLGCSEDSIAIVSATDRLTLRLPHGEKHEKVEQKSPGHSLIQRERTQVEIKGSRRSIAEKAGKQE